MCIMYVLTDNQPTLNIKNETHSFQTHVKSTRAWIILYSIISWTSFIRIHSVSSFEVIVFTLLKYNNISKEVRIRYLTCILLSLLLFCFSVLPFKTTWSERKKMPSSSGQNLEKMSKSDTIKMRNRYIGWVKRVYSFFFLFLRSSYFLLLIFVFWDSLLEQVLLWRISWEDFLIS